MGLTSYKIGIAAAALAFAVIGTGCQDGSTASGSTTYGPTVTGTSTSTGPAAPARTSTRHTPPPSATTVTSAPPSAAATSTKPASQPCASASFGQGAAAMAAARDALAAHVRTGEHACVVGLPGGFEAVLFDDTGHLRFWSSVDGSHWSQDQTASYRYDARDAKGQQLTATGTVLTGMKNATFILHGIFSGDGTGNAMAYTYGPHGWGPVLWPGSPEQRSWGKLVVASELPPETSTIQVADYKMTFNRGNLVTYDCDASHGAATCGANLIASAWRWNATGKYFEPASS